MLLNKYDHKHFYTLLVNGGCMVLKLVLLFQGEALVFYFLKYSRVTGTNSMSSQYYSSAFELHGTAQL